MFTVGHGIVLLSTIGYAVLAPLLKRVNEKIPPFTIIAISMFVLFVLSLVMSIVQEKSLSIKPDVIKANLFPLLLVGVINTIAFWLGIVGYKYMPLWQQSLFSLLTPIFTAIFAFLILGEPLSPKMFLSLILMGAGLWVAVK
jgi:drug/metabolite transporter (DMT)-like permease